jgi:hypothetical protein
VLSYYPGQQNQSTDPGHWGLCFPPLLDSSAGSVSRERADLTSVVITTCSVRQGRKGNNNKPGPPHLNDFQAIQRVASPSRVPVPDVLGVNWSTEAATRIPSGFLRSAASL